MRFSHHFTIDYTLEQLQEKKGSRLLGLSMESKSVSQPSPSNENKPNFKCPEGWTCTITKTEPSKIGKPFAKCGGSGCSCVTEKNVTETVESTEGAKVFCECGEGCICVIDETNTVKVVCA
ncbi:unnamed protein product [Lactuca saligna]|uniref:Uncharacterized protein n=1 Tax=Lactuca saligna TaxID=75948 RepID=A0AA35ZFW8_LACSI|nr:unnamed protein product [Lactuca saligna]